MTLSKKMLSILLCLTLIASLFVGIGAISASAGTEAEGKRDLDADGTYWYSDTKVSGFTSGTGTESDPYIITTAAELRHLARGSSDSAGKYYKLGNDIVINDTESANWYEGDGLKNWIKGKDDTYGEYTDTRNYREMGGDLFRGTFDGAGYTIYGLYINYEGTGKMSGVNAQRVYCGWGLFPLVYGATLKNVKLKDVYIKSNISANVTTEYHGYGALVGNVYGEQTTTFENVWVENVKFDVARPKLASAGKPAGFGGLIGYSYGNLNVTDAIVKNVTANFRNYYATSRCLVYCGAIFGAIGWGKTATLNNVLTVGKMNPVSALSMNSGGAVWIQSGNAVANLVANLSPVFNITNCYAIDCEQIPATVNITKVLNETTFLTENLDSFYANLGSSTNWSDKNADMLPQLKSFRPDSVRVLSPANDIMEVNYKSGQKLADVKVEVAGYSDDGKWYDDYDCKILSTDEYPVAGKIYYRKWTKYIKLDFETQYTYSTSGHPAYADMHDPNYVNAKYHTRADITRQTEKDGNGVLELTYSNDNPVYTAAGFNYGPTGEWFHNYKISPFLYIFDPSTGVAFKGSPGFNYAVSFDYEIEGPIPEEDVSFYLYLSDEKVGSHDLAINSLNTSSNILVGKFDVNIAEGSKGTASLDFVAKMGYIPRIVMVTNDGVRVDEAPEDYHSAYLDNITVTEELPEGKNAVSVAFDSNGGTAVSGFRVLKDSPIGKLPTPTKSGYLFDCWYLADDATQAEINPSYVATQSIKLKAKWTQVSISNYDSEGFEDFDNVRYPNVLKDYNNLDMATLKDTGILDSTMTAANRFIEENCPDGMGAALLISNSPAVMSNSTVLPATVLINKDGTKFTVKSGTVYKLEYEYLPLGETTAHSYIGVKYGSYSLDSLNGSQANGTEKVAVHGLKSEKEKVTQYFKPSTDGFVYFTLGSRQNFDNTNAQHFVLIDNVKITVVEEAKSITFVDADTGKAVDSRPVGFGYHIQYGMPGDTIREFAINTQKGKQIQGFYNDQACTIPCTDYNVIGDTNKTVYVKMKDVEYSELSNFDSPIVLDFETSEEFDLEIFYRYMPYMSWTCSELDNNLDYIGNDNKNAFDGSGYVRIKDYQFSYGIGQSFVLYDKNNPSGLMILAPNTTYRITAQAKYEDDAKIPSLKIYSLNLETLTYTRYDTTLTTKNDDMMGYGEISGLITTGDEAVGVAIGAVYLAEQNVYIDNVMVEKVVEKTITFETNGGDKIDPVVVLPYTELTSYDPGFAFKIGYEFIGWFLDKDFTKPFDFLKDTITDNITLYAKYVKEEAGDEEIGDDEGTIEDEEPKGFGDNLTVTDADPIERTDTDVDNSGLIWIIVIASIVGLLVLAGAAVLVIVLVNRKKR